MAFLGIYKAIYDYAPQSDGELEITEGDLLFVLEKSSDDDWWKAKKKAMNDDEDEPEGLIPSNYIEEAHALYRGKALYDYTKQTDEELSFAEDAQLDVYDISDPDWTLVGLNGEYGFAPAIYIEHASDAAPAHSASTPAPAPAPAPAAPAMPSRPQMAASPEPEEDWANDTPPESPQANPAAALATIIAQRTGQSSYAGQDRGLASPPLPTRPRYTPDDDDEERGPRLPERPLSEEYAPPPPPKNYSPAPAAAAPKQYASSRSLEPVGVVASPPYNRAVQFADDEEAALHTPGGFHMYNISEMVSHMGKNKKMPTTLGVNIAKGIILIAPAKARDGPSQEWTAEKLTHYSIEGKHVFIELVRPSKSVDFHAGAKDTAQEIVGALGEIAGAHRAEGLREVLAAGAGGTSGGGQKKGHMLYEFMAQGEDEVTVAVDDEVVIIDDTKSDEWWMVRRLKNGKEGVVPSSYVEITGTLPAVSSSSYTGGLNSARSTVEQNRLEEQRLAKESAKRESGAKSSERGSKRESKDKSDKPKPNSARVRTWTDRTGSFKVEAEFIGLKDSKIHLHKLNGVKIAVPVGKMAVEDLEYVEAATGVSLDDEKPLADIKRRSTLRGKERSGRTEQSQSGAKVEQTPGYDWFDFFLAAGVNPQICERYAHAFSRDQMGEEILPDVDAQLLRTLGLKEGDILRVMKYLDGKLNRTKPAGETNGDGTANGAEGGLFSGPGGALRNNTRKGRPAPAVQTNDVVDPDAFKQGQSGKKDLPADAAATPLTNAPEHSGVSGFDDDAWNVKPTRNAAPAPAPPASTPAAAPAPAPEPPKPEPPKLTPGMSDLSLLSPALQPTPAPTAAPQAPAAPQPPQGPKGADPSFFDKLGAPIARAASAPGFAQQQPSGFAPPPLQPQMTGYQAPPGKSLLEQQQMRQQQQQYAQQQAMMPQMTGYPQQQNGFMSQQQTGFPQQQQQPGFMMPQQTGFQQQQPGYQQALNNGAMANSPFADPTPRGFAPQPTGYQPMQPQQTGFGMQPQQTGLPQALQPQRTGFIPQSQFGQHVTGINNGYAGGIPPMPPMPTGYASQTGQFGGIAPQPTGVQPGPLGFSASTPALVPQKTGPAPPIRFGVQPQANKLTAQPTGRRANLANASAQNPFGF